MEKIKNAFKPDVQKEAEARKAAEQAEKSEQTATTTAPTTAPTTSSSAPQQDPTSSSGLQAEPSSDIGTGGGLTESSESKYGATPGHGVSSYQAEPGTVVEKPFHHDDPIGPGLTHGSLLATNVPQIGSTNAPQIGKPDLGGSVTEGLGFGSGNDSNNYLRIPEDDASTASIKSGVIDSTRLTPSSLGTTSTTNTMPDRSLPTTTTLGDSSRSVGTHPTFTGNRLDPAMQESTTSTNYTRDAAIGTGVVGTGAAGAGVYESTQSQEIADNTGAVHGTQPVGRKGSIGEKKSGGLSSLLHRSNPNKLHKEPKDAKKTTTTTTPATTTTSAPAITPVTATTGTAATYSAPSSDPRVSTTTGTSTSSGYKAVPAAHETFVKPGYNHEQHIGVDGQIGRPTEVSGVHGTDPSRTSVAAEVDKSLDPSNPTLLRPEESEPTLEQRQASLGEGRVIDPVTGLVKNVGKFGTGAGGTDATTQLHGYDSATQAERLRMHDEENEANKEINWEKIKDSSTIG